LGKAERFEAVQFIALHVVSFLPSIVVFDASYRIYCILPASGRHWSQVHAAVSFSQHALQPTGIVTVNGEPRNVA